MIEEKILKDARISDPYIDRRSGEERRLIYDADYKDLSPCKMKFANTNKCLRCKLPQRGTYKCQYCGYAYFINYIDLSKRLIDTISCSII